MTYVPRDQLPCFMVSTSTRYAVYAPTAAAALRWFTDPTSDSDLDVELLDFGAVEVVETLAPENQFGGCRVTANTRIAEQIAIWDTLRSQLDSDGQQLLRRLDELHCEAVVDEADRVLAIAGRLCMQVEEPDLFRRIFAITWDGCQIEPGDEMRFLHRQEPH